MLREKLLQLKRGRHLKGKLWVSIISFLAGFITHQLINYNRNKEISTHENFLTVGGNTFLVILIFSSVENLSRRKTIRETWASGLHNSLDVRYYFVISGGALLVDQEDLIKSEDAMHNDILIFHNLENSFYFLTQKVLVSFGWLTSVPVLDKLGGSWTVKQFDDFHYVLKCDDDTYVRVDELVNKLKTQHTGKKSKYLYLGFFDGRARPKKAGKYRENEWNICDNYLPYALGGGYVLSRNLVKYIADNGNDLKIFRNEDISVGMWLASHGNVHRVHDPTFDTEYISRGCHNSYVVTHKHSETAMVKFQKSIKETGKLCAKEFKTRLSYMYNWEVAPSNCCVRSNPNVP